MYVYRNCRENQVNEDSTGGKKVNCTIKWLSRCPLGSYQCNSLCKNVFSSLFFWTVFLFSHPSWHFLFPSPSIFEWSVPQAVWCVLKLHINYIIYVVSLPISSEFPLKHGGCSLENWSWTIRKLSEASAIAGGIIGFSRAGRLRVLLERWDAIVGGGLKEWLRKARVCTLVVGKASVTRSDIAWFKVY